MFDLNSLTDIPLPEGSSRSLSPLRFGSEVQTRALTANELLFEIGEIKTGVYLIETGVISIYSRVGVVELAFPGRFLGLGFLGSHNLGARAVTQAAVRVVPNDFIERLIERDPSVKEQQDTATEIEFAQLKKESVSSQIAAPLARVAGFLAAISQMNERQGGNSSVVPDTLSSGVVASYLRLDIDSLAQQLIELKNRRLIAYAPPDGIALLDIVGLQLLSCQTARDVQAMSAQVLAYLN